MKKIVVSLTSIPRRFETSLPQVIDSLLSQDTQFEIVINIPLIYAKWGAPDIPRNIAANRGVNIFRPSEDFGPATKLLGALQYCKGRNDVDYIITVDDDIVIMQRDYIRYLAACAAACPGAAVTIGGIALRHFPYSNKGGLKYRCKLKYVDIPAGYRGVSYPAKTLLGSRVPFDLKNDLPPGIFHDDDAYFGMVLDKLGIPLVAIPRKRGRGNHSAEGAGGSAVAEFADKERADNESELFQYAVEAGFFNRTKRNGSRRLPVFQKLALSWIRLRH
jgi:glycosyltransferase involved in cell wall biosynthesis